MVMRSLYRKLVRDLWRMRGQVLAIALVIASGAGVLVMSLTVVESLNEMAIAYYDRHAFADVFARVERAPEHLAARIRDIPGVQAVETRVVDTAVLDISGFQEPVLGQLISVPEDSEPLLNRLAMRQGRYPHTGAPDEAVLSEPFAKAHGLELGDTVRAVLNGRWRELRVVGIALSPEYVYAIGPGALMPDDERFGVLWLGREALQAAFDLDGAFNDVTVSLLRGTDPEAVVDRVDQILARYGGIGAYPRADQLSNWFLMNEIEQLRTLSNILPAVFLAVAAFLTNMVLARLIAVERSEIGLLKAFGYSTADIAFHYVRLVLAIGALGVLIGWIVGAWLGAYMTRIYADFYHFPLMLYQPGPRAFALAAIISLASAIAGALSTVRTASRLPPAEAMRPPAPPIFRRSGLSKLGLTRYIEQPTLILLRQIARWPGRSFLTSAGIGLSVAVLITAMQWIDAIDHIADMYFSRAQIQDVSLGFAQPRSSEITRELARLPGVLTAEPMRVVPAKLRFGSREERESVQGVPAHQLLYQIYDARDSRSILLPPDGLVISTMLAKMLGVKIGDSITVEVLEGRRPVVSIPVVGLFETYIGSPAYIEIGALSRLMRERPTVSSVHLRVDARRQEELFRALKRLPRVSAVTVKDAAKRTFHNTMAETLMIFVSFFVVFSCTLAFGVTYNAARIALSERGRELATLRVLGLSRAEVSYILLGEIALLTLVALPLGCAFGYVLARMIVLGFETELYRVPFVIELSTFGWAILIGLAATAVSALIVRVRVDRLNLISVLKTRE